MTQTTAQQRVNYAPACQIHGLDFLEAYRAKDQVFHHWSYPTNRSYTGCYACRPITGGVGYSLHSYRDNTQEFRHWDGTAVHPLALAEDVNASQNPYGPRLVTDRPRGMVDDMLKIRCNNGEQVFGWGGYYRGNKDAMHDEIVCTPAGLRSGINWSTVVGGTAPPPTGDDMPLSFLAKSDVDPGVTYLVEGNYSSKWKIPTDQIVKDLVYLNGQAKPENRFLQDTNGHVFGKAFLDAIPTLNDVMTARDQILAAMSLDDSQLSKNLRQALITLGEMTTAEAAQDATLAKVLADAEYIIEQSGWPPAPQ